MYFPSHSGTSDRVARACKLSDMMSSTSVPIGGAWGGALAKLRGAAWRPGAVHRVNSGVYGNCIEIRREQKRGIFGTAARFVTHVTAFDW